MNFDTPSDHISKKYLKKNPNLKPQITAVIRANHGSNPVSFALHCTVGDYGPKIAKKEITAVISANHVSNLAPIFFQSEVFLLRFYAKTAIKTRFFFFGFQLK